MEIAFSIPAFVLVALAGVLASCLAVVLTAVGVYFVYLSNSTGRTALMAAGVVGASLFITWRGMLSLVATLIVAGICTSTGPTKTALLATMIASAAVSIFLSLTSLKEV